MSAPGTTIELNMPQIGTHGYRAPLHLSADRRLGSIGSASGMGVGSTVAQ